MRGDAQLNFCHLNTSGCLQTDVQIACASRQLRWNQPTKSICLIDMDGTLFPFSVAPKFGLWLLRRKYLTFRSFLLALFNWWGYQLNLLAFEVLIARTFKSCLRERSPEWIEERVCEFGAAFAKRCDARVVDLLQREQPGSLTILTSRSPHFLVSYFARHFHFDAWQASFCAHPPGSGSDQFISGREKKEACQALRKVMEGEEISVTALGNTGDDIPLLSIADRAVAVAPDNTLRLKAEQMGWEIWRYLK